MSKQWRAYRKQIDSERFQVLDENGNCICKLDATAITRTRRWDEAKLIAAAPDLLDALQSIMEDMDSEHGTEYDYNKARAAIKKATE